MVRSHRQAGVALIFALIALATLALALAVVAASLQPRVMSHGHLERTVRLTALVDAAMATTLAELALDPGDAGVDERPLGDGTIGSIVTQVGLYEVDVVAVGRSRGWRSVVVARVDVEHGARVLTWRRTQSPE